MRISIIGTLNEVLMDGDIISFTGEVLGYCTYISTSRTNVTVPWLRVYAESLKVERYEAL